MTCYFWYSRRESRFWQRAPVNSGFPLFSLRDLIICTNNSNASRSLSFAPPPSISADFRYPYQKNNRPYKMTCYFLVLPAGIEPTTAP